MWLFAIFLTEFSPNPPSPQTEWVELFNDSQENVDLSGYSIRDSTASNKQILSGIIPSQNYFTFSFDHDFINNTTIDIVRLFDKNNVLIDSQASKVLPEGLSFSKQSDGTWCPTSMSPNSPNSVCQESYSLLNSPTPIPYISLEIIDATPDPNSGDESIIIRNPNNFLVSLFDWRVIDNSNSSRKISCQNIEANSDCIATFSSGYLNNDTDKIILLDPLKREISIYSYDYSKQSTDKLTSTPKPTSLPKISLPPLSNGGARLPSRVEGLDPIAPHSSSSIKINQSYPVTHYLSIILMFLGSVFILFPLIFHAKHKTK